MTAEQMGRLFRAFTQADESTSAAMVARVWGLRLRKNFVR